MFRQRAGALYIDRALFNPSPPTLLCSKSFQGGVNLIVYVLFVVYAIFMAHVCPCAPPANVFLVLPD